MSRDPTSSSSRPPARIRRFLDRAVLLFDTSLACLGPRGACRFVAVMLMPGVATHHARRIERARAMALVTRATERRARQLADTA
jgi:hypothetical protein